MGKARKKVHKKKDLTGNRTHNHKKRMFTNLVFAIGVMGIVLLFFVLMPKKSSSSDHTGNANKADETQKIVVTQEQKYQSVNDIHMDSETGVAQIDFANDTTGSTSIIVTIQLKDGEVLYTSDLLKPGDVLEQATFDKKLEQGEYDIEISVDSYSLNGDEMVGGVIYERKLIVD